MFKPYLQYPVLRKGYLGSSRHYCPSLFALVCVVLLLPSLAWADTRGSTIKGKSSAQYVVETQGKSWAVIIGVDNYLHLSPLAYAVDDAKAVARVLSRQGFSVTPLYNKQATRQAILRELRQNILTRVQKEDRVLIFFAGHIGETGGSGDAQAVGYMMPVDTEPGLLAKSAISMELLRELSNGIPAKHVLFVIDICYGGIPGSRLRSLPPMTKDYLKVITREPGRQLMTAGGTGQQALAGPKWKHSVFTYYLLEGIGKGYGDLNGDGIIPASELFTYLDEHVQSAALRHDHVQRPELWGLTPEKGEFVFVPEKPSSRPQIAQTPGTGSTGTISNPETGTIETIVGLFKNLGNPLDLFTNKIPSGKTGQGANQPPPDEVAMLKAQREKNELQSQQLLKEQQQREKQLEAQLAEAQRLAAEEERRRVAAEQARQEQETLLAQQQAAFKIEQARRTAEEEQRKQALAQQEQTRQAQLAEAQRLATEEERRRIEAERARQEKETLLAQQQAALKAEQARLAAEEEQRNQALAQLVEARRLVEEEERRRVAAEQARQEQEAHLAQQQAALKAEQARLAAEEEQRRKALAQKEQELQAQLAEARRMAAEAKAQQQRLEAEEEQRKRVLAQEEQTRQAQLAEAQRVAAEEEQRKRVLAQEEQTRQAQLAEARRVAAEEEQRKRALAQEEQTRRFQLAEAQRVAARQARLAAEEEQRKQAAEARRLAALEEERRRAAAEQARQEQEAALKAEQVRLAAEEQQRKQAAEARRLAALEEERRRAAAEQARQEQEAALKAEQVRLAAEEQQRKQAAEARRLAALEEERRRAAAEQARREQEAALKAEQARLAAEEQQRKQTTEQFSREEDTKGSQQPVVAKSGNSKPSKVLEGNTPLSEGVSVADLPTLATPPIPESSPDQQGSGFFGFFKNIFQEKQPEAQGDIPKKSQPEPVLEARLRPQDLPDTFSSGVSGNDGAPMVMIPAGKFIMGSAVDQIPSFLKDFDGVPSDAFQAEIPERQIILDAYYIDQYEVSYRLYGQFVESTGRSLPKFWGDDRFHQLDHPVLGVTWYEATAYCTWAGKRLPTEAEWEKAARGTHGYAYPWGNSWDSARTNTAGYWAGKSFSSIAQWAEWMQTALDRREAGPLNIGTFSGGISPYGVHDMAGNVSEWVSDWYTPYTTHTTLIRNPQGADSGTMKVHRGGSWSVSSIFARSAYRARENPERGSPYIGMRCAMTPK